MQYNYENLLDNIHDGVYFVDQNRKITYWNKAAEKLTGFSADEVLGSHCSDNILIHIDKTGRSLCSGACPLAAAIADGQSREAHVFMHHKDGHRVPVVVRATQLSDDDGNIVGGAEFFYDESSQVAMENRLGELNKLAMLDKLTQLPNRNHIEPELESRFEEQKRYGIKFGIIFLDIDHFKSFNDNYGHDIGDIVLQTLAKTLMANTRLFDTWGRWGGEEFIGIIRNIDKPMLQQLAERIRIIIENTLIHTKEQSLNITASLGVTIVQKNDTIESIMKRADNLLYQSKQNGRNQITCD